MQERGTTDIIRILTIDLIWPVIFFPFWWYSAGLLRVLKWAGRTLIGEIHTTGITVWFKNLFVPMFGQRDLTGRLISFVLRLFTIVWYTFVLLLTLMFVLVVVLVWVSLPLLTAYELMLHAQAFTSPTSL